MTLDPERQAEAPAFVFDGFNPFLHPLNRNQGGKNPSERAKEKETGAELKVRRGVFVEQDRCFWWLRCKHVFLATFGLS